MLMPMWTSAARAGAASSPAASTIPSDVRLIVSPPVLGYPHPGPASLAVARAARAEPRQRPQLRLGRPPALGLGDEHRAQLGAGRGGETLAAPDRLPHLAQLLRARPRPPGLAAAEERRAHLLEEVLLLPRREAPRDALPEVPPLGAALHGAGGAQSAPEHEPEPRALPLP